MLSGSRSSDAGCRRVEILCALSLGCWFVSGPGAQAQAVQEAPLIEHSDPPYFDFYAKAIDCDGIFIRGSALVDDHALVIACMRIRDMTASMDVAKQNLRQRGVELHIVGRGQKLSILPENLSVRGSSKVSGLPQKSDTDGSRAQSGIYSACGEESLLATASDAGKNSTDLCTREFAIALMNYGFDDEIRRLIESQYHSSVAAGHWNGTRAAASPEDYWAELSMWYFDTRASFAAQGRSAESAANAIRAEDPSGFALVDLLYTQKKRPVAIEAIRARAVSKLALSSVSTRPAELQLVNNSGKNIRFFWIDTEGELRPIGELGPYNRTIEKTFFQHVWMIEDQRGVEIQRFVIEDYVSEVIAAY